MINIRFNIFSTLRCDIPCFPFFGDFRTKIARAFLESLNMYGNLNFNDKFSLP